MTFGNFFLFVSITSLLFITYFCVLHVSHNWSIFQCGLKNLHSKTSKVTKDCGVVFFF